MRHLWAIVVAIAMSSSALGETAADKAQNACALSAYKTYLVASLARSQREGVTSSVADVIEGRRMMEGYCAQFVQCLHDVPAIALGTMFSKCLDDEDADRINDLK